MYKKLYHKCPYLETLTPIDPHLLFKDTILPNFYKRFWFCFFWGGGGRGQGNSQIQTLPLKRSRLYKYTVKCSRCKLNSTQHFHSSWNCAYIIDGKTKIGARVRSNLWFLISWRHLIRSRAVTNRIFSSCMRNMIWFTSLYEYHDSWIHKKEKYFLFYFFSSYKKLDLLMWLLIFRLKTHTHTLGIIMKKKL